MAEYDIIGDIHGQGDKLIQLLEKIGYTEKEGVYQHPEGRKVLFLGDFIDRGPKQKLVVETVRSMVEGGHALAIMGNHEFNAICFHTKCPQTQAPLRAHSDKNKKQHGAFLDEYPVGSKETQSVIDWFKTLPVYLELDGLRAIHACWDQAMVDEMTSYLDQDKCLKPDAYTQASKKGTRLYHLVEDLMKGPEITLPDGAFFHDKDGNKRTAIRYKWWESNLKTYWDAAIAPKDVMDNIPKLPINLESKSYPDDAPHVFFGHYWFTGTPMPVQDNVACLDYSAGKGGPLVAYRWHEGAKDKPLNPQKFIGGRTG